MPESNQARTIWPPADGKHGVLQLRPNWPEAEPGQTPHTPTGTAEGHFNRDTARATGQPAG